MANGYGRVGHVYAHRFIWELVNGPLPEGLCVCHTCDTPICVNPRHLFLGTPADNHADMTAKGRANHAAKSQPGEFNPTSKLTNIQVLDIRRRVVMNGSGRPGNWRQLAAEFNVCASTIRQIAKRQIWKHI